MVELKTSQACFESRFEIEVGELLSLGFDGAFRELIGYPEQCSQEIWLREKQAFDVFY